MFSRTGRTGKADCPVCYMAHDDEIHEARLSIHRWLFAQVTHSLVDDSYFAAEPQPDQIAS
jgi:hypothetical protein